MGLLIHGIDEKILIMDIPQCYEMCVQYATKRKELREAGRSKEETKDEYAFLHMRNKIEVL